MEKLGGWWKAVQSKGVEEKMGRMLASQIRELNGMIDDLKAQKVPEKLLIEWLERRRDDVSGAS
jgi:hypothetical protein